MDTQSEMPTEEEIERLKADPEAAYAEAERRINLARITEQRSLWLGGSAFTANLNRVGLLALERIPDSIKVLRTIEHLVLDQTNISSIDPISELFGLKQLSLSGTPVDDITAVGRMGGLTYLNLANTRVSDIDILINHPNLEMLFLGSSEVYDVRGVSECLRLRQLD